MAHPQAALARCHREAEEVKELMKQNMAKAWERDGKLEELGGRAEELSAMSSTFRRSTRAVRKQQRPQRRCGGSATRWAALGAGAAVLLLLLGLGLGLGLRRGGGAEAERPTGEPGSARWG